MAFAAEFRDATILDGEFPYIAADAVSFIPREFALKFDVLAYRVLERELHVIVANESDEILLDRIRSVAGMRVRATSAPREWIRNCLKLAYDAGEAPERDMLERDDAPSAIRVVDELHDLGASFGASDIHIEPSGDGGRVRYRVDGILREVRRLPVVVFPQVVSRVKLLAGMDIADKRQPQDGRYHIDLQGRSIDARVSSIPTIAGEKLAVRLLDMQARVPGLSELGMAPAMLARYRALVHCAHGFVVVCGPTGSGKTTTLYASLDERNAESENLCTIEDPVEARIAGIAQVQVHSRAGVTFASALRAFLRQDPNVILIGEMRDSETAASDVGGSFRRARAHELARNRRASYRRPSCRTGLKATCHRRGNHRSCSAAARSAPLRTLPRRSGDCA